MVGNNVKTIVKSYGNILKKNNFTYSKIYLFGSYAKGKADKNSDIDVAVVAEGSGVSGWLKKMKLWQLARRIDTRIEPILLSSKEFSKNKASQMAVEVKKTGKRIV